MPYPLWLTKPGQPDMLVHDALSHVNALAIGYSDGSEATADDPVSHAIVADPEVSIEEVPDEAVMPKPVAKPKRRRK